jgi:hypothetical protein
MRSRYDIFLKLVELIQAGKLEVLISLTFSLSQTAAAHRFVESHEQFGSVSEDEDQFLLFEKLINVVHLFIVYRIQPSRPQLHQNFQLTNHTTI